MAEALNIKKMLYSLNPNINIDKLAIQYLTVLFDIINSILYSSNKDTLINNLYTYFYGFYYYDIIRSKIINSTNTIDIINQINYYILHIILTNSIKYLSIMEEENIDCVNHTGLNFSSNTNINNASANSNTSNISTSNTDPVLVWRESSEDVSPWGGVGSPSQNVFPNQNVFCQVGSSNQVGSVIDCYVIDWTIIFDSDLFSLLKDHICPESLVIRVANVPSINNFVRCNSLNFKYLSSDIIELDLTMAYPKLIFKKHSFIPLINCVNHLINLCVSNFDVFIQILAIFPISYKHPILTYELYVKCLNCVSAQLIENKSLTLIEKKILSPPKENLKFSELREKEELFPCKDSEVNIAIKDVSNGRYISDKDRDKYIIEYKDMVLSLLNNKYFPFRNYLGVKELTN